jgi:Fe-Mn family superoxide dismutase
MNAKVSAPFTLPPLPWDEAALDPVISARTMSFHYGKHHKAYVDKLNELSTGTKYAELPLERVVVESAKDDAAKKIFNNAAQIWNHTFFWNSMKPQGGGKPTGELAAAIDASFGSYDDFKKRFAQAAVDQFGSGWAWLVVNNGKLALSSTSNAGTPIAEGITPLLTIDVWEHAYYLDYQNKRLDFANAVIDKLVNWEHAAAQLRGAGSLKAA